MKTDRLVLLRNLTLAPARSYFAGFRKRWRWFGDDVPVYGPRAKAQHFPNEEAAIHCVYYPLGEANGNFATETLNMKTARPLSGSTHR